MTTNLPIQFHLDEIVETMDETDDLIIHAPPGAGKTTLVPPALLNCAWLGSDKILLLEPRRIAARAAAQRMADLQNEPVGGRIGYRMRLESRVSESTQIEVITEGILARMLMDDPSLGGVSTVIFDEFHERSLDADLGLALCLKSRELFRSKPLKLILMSATLDDTRVSTLLNNAPIITTAGKSYPVDIVHETPFAPRDRIDDRVIQTVKKALKKHPSSSILVFLPGEGEIRRVADRLSSEVDADTRLTPLYGNLNFDEQRAAIAPLLPSDTYKRKVVLATNIAESSLTIEGIDVVIDGGLERRAVYDPNTAMQRLQTNRISQASATQRAGRAGRLAPGTCYRIWSIEQHQQLAAYSEPEINHADLTSLVLQVLYWGSAEELRWLDAPSKGAWGQATELLSTLGAIEPHAGSHKLTHHGEQMSRLPVAPRLAHMMIKSADINHIQTGCALAAVLSERDAFSRINQSDLDYRVSIVLGDEPCPAPQQNWLRRSKNLTKRFQTQVLQLDLPAFHDLPADEVIGFLVASAYPDRIARRRHAGTYQLANGRSAGLQDGDPQSKHRWLAAAEVGGVARRKGDVIRLAAALNISLFETLLSDAVSTQQHVDWDTKAGRFIAEEQKLIGKLVLSRTPIVDVSPEAKAEGICEHIRKQGLSLFNKFEEFKIYRNRIELIKSEGPGTWPDLSDEHLLESLDDWLGIYLAPITKLKDLKKIDILEIWQSRIGRQGNREIDRLAPESVKLGSGSQIKIDYSNTPPILAVKLQEMFGSKTGPAILGGKLPLLIHLLSPAGRPLQVTSDLASFWQSAYSEVQKDMKGRYPKHPWPDDPVGAEPTRHTKKRS